MDTRSMLGLTLNEILHVVNPLREDMEIRGQIIDDIRKAIDTVESLRGATVEPFGSFVSQLYTRWGDLDISIELSTGLYIAVASRKLKQALLGDLMKALRRTDSFRRLQSVSHARVPILKAESVRRNISCDISINNISGKMKSKFLLWISLIDIRFRDMVLLVKEWAKANNINNPKHGSFNSYSLSLLVIFHLQTCLPAILPPLKDLYSQNMADELIGVKAEVENHIEEVAYSNIAKFRKERRINHSSLAELFTSFLAKFSDLNTRATGQGICTFNGRWEDINTTTRWLPKTYAIFIADPFEQPENTARAVTSNQLNRIASVFAATYNCVVAPNQTRNTLIPSLVRYEISRFFPGAAFGIPMTGGGTHSRANQIAQHRTRQFQPNLQQARPPGRPNNMNLQRTNHGPVLGNNQQLPKTKSRSRRNRVAKEASEGQAQINMAAQKPVKAQQPQQIWRPKQIG